MLPARTQLGAARGMVAISAHDLLSLHLNPALQTLPGRGQLGGRRRLVARHLRPHVRAQRGLIQLLLLKVECEAACTLEWAFPETASEAGESMLRAQHEP